MERRAPVVQFSTVVLIMSSGSQSDDSSGNKRRLPTYYARKDEMRELQDESRRLRKRLRELEQAESERVGPVRQAIRRRNDMLAVVRHNALVLAGAQSLFTTGNMLSALPPLESYIHLPLDVAKRQSILVGLRGQKLHDATAYLLARCHALDLRRPHRQVENTQTDDGDRITINWDVNKFEGEKLTAKRVFDAMLFFLRMQEIIISEQLDQLSIRESDVVPDDRLDVDQVRLVTTHREGLLSEKNMVMYSEFFPMSDRVNQPYGVLVADSIDQDDAFPYQSQSRLRRDIVSANMVVELEPGVVSLVRWTTAKIYKSPLVSDATLDRLSRSSLDPYFDTMLQVMRERLGIPEY